MLLVRRCTRQRIWSHCRLGRSGRRGSARRRGRPIDRCERCEDWSVIILLSRAILMCERNEGGLKSHRSGSWGWIRAKSESVHRGLCIYSPKLLKIHSPTLIHIKHAYHHLNRMLVKTRKIAIDQRLAQFPFRQLSRAILVHGLE